MTNTKYLVVISIDALNYHDFDYIKKLPTFQTFIDNGSYVREISSIYPTSTYPCHTTIVTGAYPDKHGIYANEIAQPHKEKQEWYWYKKYIKMPTIFDYAKRDGLTTAAVLWPVMGGATITYNCPEVWSVDGVSKFKLNYKYGSKKLLPAIIINAHRLKGTMQPYLDNFTTSITNYLISKKKPNLLFVHLTELDHERHVIGLNGKTIPSILDKIDQRIKSIIDATKKANTYNDTTFILLGDHGTNDYASFIHVNTKFAQEGLITVDEDNKIVNWQAYCNSCGGSAQIHIKSKNDKKIIQKVEDILGKLSVRPGTMIKRFYSKEDVQSKYNLNGDFEFVLEAKDGYIFKNNIQDTLITSIKDTEDVYVAEHGYEPTHGNMRTLFLAMGKGIKKGVSVSSANLVDEAPTMAKLLDFNMTNIDGHAINEILEN